MNSTELMGILDYNEHTVTFCVFMIDFEAVFFNKCFEKFDNKATVTVLECFPLLIAKTLLVVSLMITMYICSQFSRREQLQQEMHRRSKSTRYIVSMYMPPQYFS